MVETSAHVAKVETVCIVCVLMLHVSSERVRILACCCRCRHRGFASSQLAGRSRRRSARTSPRSRLATLHRSEARPEQVHRVCGTVQRCSGCRWRCSRSSRGVRSGGGARSHRSRRIRRCRMIVAIDGGRSRDTIHHRREVTDARRWRRGREAVKRAIRQAATHSNGCCSCKASRGGGGGGGGRGRHTTRRRCTNATE